MKNPDIIIEKTDKGLIATGENLQRVALQSVTGFFTDPPKQSVLRGHVVIGEQGPLAPFLPEVFEVEKGHAFRYALSSGNDEMTQRSSRVDSLRNFFLSPSILRDLRIAAENVASGVVGASGFAEKVITSFRLPDVERYPEFFRTYKVGLFKKKVFFIWGMRSKNDHNAETRTLLQQIDDFEKYLRKRFVKHLFIAFLFLALLGGTGTVVASYYREPLEKAWTLVSEKIPGTAAYYLRLARERAAAGKTLLEIKELSDSARKDAIAAQKFAKDGADLAANPTPLVAAIPHVNDAVTASQKAVTAADALDRAVAIATESAQKPDPVATAAQLAPAKKNVLEAKAGKDAAQAAYEKIKSLREEDEARVAAAKKKQEEQDKRDAERLHKQGVEKRKAEILEIGNAYLATAEKAAKRAEIDRDAATQRADALDSPLEARPRAAQSAVHATASRKAVGDAERAHNVLKKKVAALGDKSSEKDFAAAKAAAEDIKKPADVAVREAGEATIWRRHTLEATSRFKPVGDAELKEAAAPISPQ
jgi:hypothetical protein